MADEQRKAVHDHWEQHWRRVSDGDAPRQAVFLPPQQPLLTEMRWGLAGWAGLAIGVVGYVCTRTVLLAVDAARWVRGRPR